VFEAALASWTLRPGWLVVLLAVAVVYLRGWLVVSRILPGRFPLWRAVCFISGLGAFYVAVASPLDRFAALLLQAHMLQHLLLTMVVPPLLLLGYPLIPLVRGLPRSWSAEVVSPLLNWRPLQRLGGWLVFPPVALALFMISNVVWHFPGFYDAALRDPWVHEIEHACFLLTATLFWWPVVEPWPYRRVWPRWSVIPYLLLADLQNTALGGFLSFYDEVLYPTYAVAPRIFGMDALSDQSVSGALMWVPGSIAFLVPAGMIAASLLSGRKGVRPSEYFRKEPRDAAIFVPKEKIRGGSFDLLRLPWLGKIFSSLIFRRFAQGICFALALLVVIDGFLGPDLSPLNLAGVLPWTYWRGFAVLALVFVGNLFCFSCPFILARDVVRRFWVPRLRWPRWLRLKWVAVGLVLVYLWAYEAFALWDQPWLTAWLVLGYFGSAILVDGLFKGATFCKYLCPIGQFHFTQSLTSPFEVKIRQPSACSTCRTHDCLRGNETSRGCELSLFQPHKRGNMDCTFCLDCVRACPHDNIGVVLVPPGRDLWMDSHRSGVGKYQNRTDLAVLCLVFVFGAFVNAAGMVEPVVSAFDRFLGESGLTARALFVGVFVGLGCLVIPFALSWLAARFTVSASQIRQTANAFSFALVPLGLAMWAAHFLFHLLTGWGTVLPAAERFFTGSVVSLWIPPLELTAWLIPLELLFLNAGFLVSSVAVWKTGGRLSSGRPWKICIPWFLLLFALYYLGCWIFFQPMEMRGTLLH